MSVHFSPVILLCLNLKMKHKEIARELGPILYLFLQRLFENKILGCDNCKISIMDHKIVTLFAFEKRVCTAHWGKNQLFFQKLLRILCLKNMNFVKNEALKM